MSTIKITDPSTLSPLSSAQSRIWILEHMDGNLSAFNNQLVYKVKGNPDIDLLDKSISILVERHDILRTIFVNGNGIPAQKILPRPDTRINVVQLMDQPPDIQQKLISDYVVKSGKRKFDLAIGPLFSFDLLVLGNDEFVFLINFHHIITDAVSADIFFGELITVYSALSSNSSPDLPGLNYSFAEHALKGK